MNAVLDDLDKLTPQVTSQSIEETLNMFSLANESLKMAQPVFSCIAVVKQAEIPNEMRKTRKIHLLKSEEVQ